MKKKRPLVKSGMRFIIFSSVIGLISTQGRPWACISSSCCSLSSPTATPSLGGRRPATHSFRQYLWPGLRTTTKLIKTPSAKRSALMELHHNAFGLRMYYQHPRCHHLPSLRAQRDTHMHFYNPIRKQEDRMVIQIAESYKNDANQLYKHQRKWS